MTRTRSYLVAVEPHADGTLTIAHYGTRYFHWWVGEIKRRRGYYTATIYGKTGGEAWIRLSKLEAQSLREAFERAQQLALESESKHEQQ